MTKVYVLHNNINSHFNNNRKPEQKNTSMLSSNHNKILENIKQRIEISAKILIVVSKPIDPDCIGTGLSLKWLLEENGKSVDIVRFINIPHEMTTFPDIDNITEIDNKLPDFKIYDAVILVDGCDWAQFFGDNWQEILNLIDKNKIINLDHHIPGNIQQTVSDNCLIKRTSCTGQLLFEHFIEPSNIKLTKSVAEYLYLALLYDSGNFKYEIYPGQYSFAEKLIAAGADHAKAMDINYDKKEIDFMVWAIEHTDFLPELKLSMLVINRDLNLALQKKFGENWSDFDKFYKEAIERQIRGFNYGIILIENMDGIIRLGWRTRNYGETLSVAEIARNCGFNAGGHRNAGGGRFNGKIEDAKKNLLNEFKKLTD